MNNNSRKYLDQLETNGTAAVLITFPLTDETDFEDLTGLDVRIQSSQSMSDSDTAHVLMAMAIKFYKHLGLIPDDFGRK